MAFEPQLLAPIEGGGLVEYYKPWLIGRDAFPRMEDAYCWRGTVKKREGYEILASLPVGPVMGLPQYLIPNSGLPQQIAFNTTQAFLLKNSPLPPVYNNISFFSDFSPVTWTGTNTNFFYSSNFADSLWTTNNKDPIRIWNGNSLNGWSNQFPLVGANPDGTSPTYVTSCLIIIPYRRRLVILNTVENSIPFFQRARWCQIGTPYCQNPTINPPVIPDPPVAPPPNWSAPDNDAWRSDIPGRGGYTDADTDERIIGAGIVRNTLIVFFQKSTWRLKYVGETVNPFEWERINTQYGADSTFASIEFDEAVLTFSRYGFIASNTNTLKRIDEKIPDQTFQSMQIGTNLADLQKVQGIRDFYRQTAYWCYSSPDNTDPNKYPNKVLAYNYLDKTWSRYNMNFTCFGYYQTFNDLIWSDFVNIPMDEWQNQDESWNAPWFQNSFPQILAGDQYGNVYKVFDVEANDQDQVGPNVMGKPVNKPINFIIDTKFMNPYIGEGARCRLQYMDLYIDSTVVANPPNNGGAITVQYYVDDNLEMPIKTLTVTTSEVQNASRYVRVFLGATARVHLLRFTLSQSQITDPIQSVQPFVLQGVVLWTRKEGRLRH